MKYHINKLWLILVAMVIVTTFALQGHQAYSFSIPEITHSQIDKNDRIVSYYAISFPAFHFSCSLYFYSLTTSNFDFYLQPVLRLVNTTLNPFIKPVIDDVITINGP